MSERVRLALTLVHDALANLTTEERQAVDLVLQGDTLRRNRELLEEREQARDSAAEWKRHNDQRMEQVHEARTILGAKPHETLVDAVRRAVALPVVPLEVAGMPLAATPALTDSHRCRAWLDESRCYREFDHGGNHWFEEPAREPTARQRVYSLVDKERARQEARFPGRSIASTGVPDLTRLRILVEEVGEVAEALDQEANTKRELTNELTQVAACAVGWLELINGE